MPEGPARALAALLVLQNVVVVLALAYVHAWRQRAKPSPAAATAAIKKVWLPALAVSALNAALLWDVRCTAAPGGCPRWAWLKVAVVGALTLLVVGGVLRATRAYYENTKADAAAPDVFAEAGASRREAIKAAVDALLW